MFDQPTTPPDYDKIYESFDDSLKFLLSKGLTNASIYTLMRKVYRALPDSPDNKLILSLLDQLILHAGAMVTLVNLCDKEGLLSLEALSEGFSKSEMESLHSFINGTDGIVSRMPKGKVQS